MVLEIIRCDIRYKFCHNINSKDLKAIISRAKIKSKIKDHTGSIKDYSRVLELDPNNQEAIYLEELKSIN